MSTQEDVRRISMGLPGVEESLDGFAFSVKVKGKPKGFVWAWNERVNPKRPKVPNLGVLAVRVPNLSVKEILLTSDPEKFFTEDHYNGYPAILVRLESIDPEELEDLIIEAWRCKAPSELIDQIQSSM